MLKILHPDGSLRADAPIGEAGEMCGATCTVSNIGAVAAVVAAIDEADFS